LGSSGLLIQISPQLAGGTGAYGTTVLPNRARSLALYQRVGGTGRFQCVYCLPDKSRPDDSLLWASSLLPARCLPRIGAFLLKAKWSHLCN